MSPCRRCASRCMQQMKPDLAELLATARGSISEAEIIPPNLRSRTENMACESAVWAVEQDEKACRLWWSMAPRKSA